MAVSNNYMSPTLKRLQLTPIYLLLHYLTSIEHMLHVEHYFK
jgi:hypothetical protein